MAAGRNLLEKLSGVGGFEQQNACRTLLQEVEPVIRLCKYEINRAGGSANQLALAAEGASLREKAVGFCLETLVYGHSPHNVGGVWVFGGGVGGGGNL